MKIMKEITKIMIKKYCLKKLKYDMMGYMFKKPQELSFHHTILSHKYCKKLGLGEGYWEWNGSILVQKTSHDFLHIVENYDFDRFLAITNELIDENIKEYVDKDNLIVINDILKGFEREYCSVRNKNNNLIIKEEYTRRLIK